jgi:hypothetical protein
LSSKSVSFPTDLLLSRFHANTCFPALTAWQDQIERY